MTTPTFLTSQYDSLIVEVDKLLGTLRIKWMEARDETEKGQWMRRINTSLDERLRLMAARGAAAKVTQ